MSMQKFNNSYRLHAYLECILDTIFHLIFGIKIINTFFLHYKDFKEKLFAILLKITPETRK